MIDQTIILLTYYYNPSDRDDGVLGQIIRDHCPAFLPWDMYLYEPLRKVFRQVVIYDYLKRRAEIGRKAMNEEIIGLVRREQPKYVLWTSFYYDIGGSTFQAIRQAGAFVVGWFCDDDWRFDSYSKYWASYLDYCVTNDINVVPKYIAIGTPALRSIPNSGVDVPGDWVRRAEKYDVTFVGTIRFADRQSFTDRIKQEGLPITIFGEGTTGYVSFDEMIAIFQNSKINLNFSKAGAFTWTRQKKGRVFQVCLAGGFMLTENSPDIDTYFEPGKEIAVFEDENEMIEKIRYYLAHEEERLAIARAGWERATKSYSASHLVAEAFHEIEQTRLAPEKMPARPEPGTRPRMPLLERTLLPSYYQFQWGKAFMEHGYPRRLWGDSLAQAIRISPLNVAAWYYLGIGCLPRPFRRPFFELYAAAIKFLGIVYRRLRSMRNR